MIYSLQVLRGIAAIMVVLYHYATWGTADVFVDYPLVQNMFSRGASGVNLFFIISGFIMYQVARRESTPAEFISKRLLRIIPLYWLLLFTHSGVQVFVDAATYKSMLFIPLSLETPPFFGYASYTPGWTLNYEMFFYLLFSVALFFKRFKYVVIFGAFALLHAVFCYTSDVPFWQSFDPYVQTSISIPYFAMMANPIILLFGVGIVLGFVYQKSKQCHYLYPLITFVVLTTLMICFPSYLANYGGHGVRSTLSCILLFITFISTERFLVSNKIAFNIAKPFVFLGTISYSIYLIHILFVTNHTFTHIEGLSPFANFVLIMAVVIISSYITYYFVEKRFTDFLRRKLKSMRGATSKPNAPTSES